MLESEPIYNGIEVLNDMNDSNDLFTEEIQIEENVEFLKSFSLSPPQNINTTVIDSNISIPCAQLNKKSMQLKIKIFYELN